MTDNASGTAIRSLTPEQTQERLSADGFLFVDVRSEPEFEAGHVPGSLNVPIMHKEPSGMVENPDFLPVMQGAFAPETKLILGCRSGRRSLRAAQMLVAAGFSEVFEMSAGWEGGTDDFGRPRDGWAKTQLPVETGKPEAQAYAAVKAKAGL